MGICTIYDLQPVSDFLLLGIFCDAVEILQNASEQEWNRNGNDDRSIDDYNELSNELK